ncbi:hypothetical protein GP486_004695 [Trichoglossum hirsutum]|uniref:Nucleoside phosphorylase domain-containing protein n=1 Tax=Trichoglossum hirsutum TaxID=265104 RepID=A0A9P8LAN3_9PEZI|nr:hypothetical protein GP486_004695 [Trichoglossum hirsutum]
MATTKVPSPEDYTVGWVCAQVTDLAAVTALLDDTYPDMSVRSIDCNPYELGRMGKHNIVISCLPAGEYGTAAAAVATAQMMQSFESIQFILSLGTAGGVPQRHDIRLGDVVVSYPTYVFGGVVQHDMGKTLAGGLFHRTGSLNKPAQTTLTAVAKLRAIHMMETSSIQTFLSNMTTKYPRLITRFTHPGQHEDRLYYTGYEHVSGDSCEHCDQDMLVARCARATDNPVVHYGVIASGNSLIKDSATRDYLSKELDALCIDMEAAGLMDHFPCLAIRGISDYADSHKNGQWQAYAAATAAAYAKELLDVIHPTRSAGALTIPRALVTAVQESGARREDYTIGWICALSIEMAVAMATLDCIHPDLPVRPIDHNTYAFGRIGKHNIVIACLPAGVYGTTSAAVAAAQMMNSFESIRFGLLVGIGGGMPREGVDIRLGDVVVSRPSEGHGGVVQFDQGKISSYGVFRRIGALNAPPNGLRAAVGRLMAMPETEENISKNLSVMLKRYPHMEKADFLYQGEEHDLLFNSLYTHHGGNSCHSCDKTQLVKRVPRKTSPRIHYGTIGSANQVVKDAAMRDKLGAEFGIICVEMEAAGLMNNFPCLVVRGICDYADSHKAKRWQPHAAATAAAYAKELLSVIPRLREITTMKALEAIQIK